MIRIGQGYDCHAFAPNRKLIIGGVTIPYEKGLLGHSDADVLLHAIIDALLGALALGDIGKHFPDTDHRYLGIDSRVLLKEVYRLVLDKGYALGNLDATIITEAPKMAPYIEKMRENLASDLQSDLSQISIKAKTNEKMGFVGRKEGIATLANLILVKR